MLDLIIFLAIFFALGWLAGKYGWIGATFVWVREKFTSKPAA